MALVCDLKSEVEKSESSIPANDEDLEDGEIEDDDDVPPTEETTPTTQNSDNSVNSNKAVEQNKLNTDRTDRERIRDRSKERRERRHKDKEPRHMTEAERSILHLRRKERLEREKWKNYRKDHQPLENQDDFAINLEKTLASILKKDKVTSDEDKEDERRSGKRKKRGRDNDHKAKQRKIDSPKSEEIDDEMINIRGGSPEQLKLDKDERIRSPRSDNSYDSEHSSDHNNSEKPTRNRREKRRDNRKGKNKKDRNFKRDKSRDRKNENQTDNRPICHMYLNGKCFKNDCKFSHETVTPLKLELCKFYLMDCCAKGDNCSYMHSNFPCKFYHLGLPCTGGGTTSDNCKFAHGKPLSDGLKQILFKHIETAPRDILGGFPRLNRDEILNMMDKTQTKLKEMFGETKKSDEVTTAEDNAIPSLFDIDVTIPSELREPTRKSLEKSGRNRPSRWQEPDPVDKTSNINLNVGPFNFTQDQDMRINSNGDIDMRTLPPHPMSSIPQPLPSSLPLVPDLSQPEMKKLQNISSDVDIRNFTSDVDIRTFESGNVPKPINQTHRFLGNQDVDIRQLIPPLINIDEQTIENQQQSSSINIPSHLPKVQQELYLRIQSQQRENMVSDEKNDCDDNIQDSNWYSEDDDDDDENRLTIKFDSEEFASGKDKCEEEGEKEDKTEENSNVSESSMKAQDVVEKLGDLSKINITPDITKLLSTLSSSIQKIPTVLPTKENENTLETTVSDYNPAMDLELTKDKPMSESKSLQDPRTPESRDPRRGGTTSVAVGKLTIYEQGVIDLNNLNIDEDFKSCSRPDVDLRNLGIPIKGMQNYTPATEIDASISLHPPITWKVVIIDIPRPDYSGLKLSVSDASKTGDPRLRKIFRLSIEERDTPTSPKGSNRGISRIDPRLRKTEETKPIPVNSSVMNYTQQLSTLHGSMYYQSITSNQKLMLNQKLASISDQSGLNNPILNCILILLDIIPPMNTNIQNEGHNFEIARHILQTINKMNPIAPITMMNNINPSIINTNPAILNLMSQGVIQPGLLGAAPGIPNMPQDFPLNFDPRLSNGMIGTNSQFSNFEPPIVSGPGGFQNFPNDDFYQHENNQNNFRSNNNNNNSNRNDRGGNFNNRDRRRGGRNNFGRNQGNRNQFRRNQGGRSNRSHSPS